MERSQTLGGLQDEVEDVLEEIRDLVVAAVDVEEAVVVEGPSLIVKLLNIMRPVFVLVAGEVTYQNAAEEWFKGSGFRLQHNNLVLHDTGSFSVHGAENPSSISADEFLPKHLESKTPRLKVFTDLIEDVVETFTYCLKKMDEERKETMEKLYALSEKVKVA